MISKAKTVADYLDELPEDRRAAINAVRQVIRRNLDKGYEEGMCYGGIGYYVPHKLYPAGYHCDPSKPLPFAGVASQKHYMAVYLMCIYGDSGEDKWFRSAWAKTGKKLDMGKCCVRFRKLDDLALDLIGEAIARMPVKKYVALYESLLPASRKPGNSKTPKKTTTKKRAAKRMAKT
jgi:hypothetical protein